MLDTISHISQHWIYWASVSCKSQCSLQPTCSGFFFWEVWHTRRIIAMAAAFFLITLEPTVKNGFRMLNIVLLFQSLQEWEIGSKSRFLVGHCHSLYVPLRLWWLDLLGSLVRTTEWGHVPSVHSTIIRSWNQNQAVESPAVLTLWVITSLTKYLKNVQVI